MQGSAGRRADWLGEGEHGSDISLFSQTIYNTRIYGTGVFKDSRAYFFLPPKSC
jgi:hypothetical protein